ncbi:MAG: membrane dipeptidase [Chloroflexi bacterium]|nr:membrane dipeptidase [Chloroflexota bacterium]
MAVSTLPPVSARAQALHARSIVVDGCSFFLRGYNDRIRASGLTAINFTVALPMEDMAQAVLRIKEYYDTARRDPKVIIARAVADIERAKAKEQLAAIVGSQNSAHFGTDLGLIEIFHVLGQRVCQLTYNERNFVGDGCMEPNDAGLSFFGRQVVAELNRLGMVIDLSHVGVRTSFEAIEASEQPVIISHIGVKKIADTPRTASDDLMRAVAAKGGVVGITSYQVVNWRGGDRRPSFEDFLAALEHAISVVGIDHVGYGSDHVVEPNGYPAWVREYLSTRYNPYSPQRGPRMSGLAELMQAADLEPDEQLEGFRGIQDLPRLTDALLARGYSEEDVQKVLGGNFLRVLRQVWGG